MSFLIFPTTYLIELILAGNIFLAFAGQLIKKNKKALDSYVLLITSLLLFLLFYLLLIGIVKSNNIDKEVFRALQIGLLIFAYSVVLSKEERDFHLNTICWLSIAFGILTFIEFVFINLNVSESIIYELYSTAIHSHYAESDQYLTDVSYFGLFELKRPFGILGQPQKSVFVFVISMIALEILNSNKSRNFFLVRHRIAFIFFMLTSAFLSGGKTGFMAALVIVLILLLNHLEAIYMYILVFLAIILFNYQLLNPNNIYSETLLSDLNAITQLTPFQLVFGFGFMNEYEYVNIFNASREYFIIRAFIELGIAMSLVMASTLWIYIRSRFDRVCQLILWTAIIAMTFHYSILNSYYIMITVSILLAGKIYRNK